jgi:pSer/pThr/pTyr-binding forkhead associated (FHA) protein
MHHGNQRDVRITYFPFKVGRESRTAPKPRTTLTELRLGVSPQVNDLYLIEPEWVDLMQISREHFTIEYVDSRFFLLDRGSICGTIVGGRQIGGNRQGGRTELRSGDLIVVGSETSEYVFRFEVI